MIKGIIIDVDGVVVGEKTGYNFPDPHPEVIKRLKQINARGIPVSLCTGKPSFAIQKVIADADLRSLHITDGGGVIIDPLDNLILKSHVIEPEPARQLIQTCLDNDAYVEFYTIDQYFIQASQQNDTTAIHADILQAQPVVVPSLVQESASRAVTKVMPIAHDDDDMRRLDALLQPFAEHVTISWSVHPVALPRRFGIITAKGISKQQAAKTVAEHNGIAMHEMLGIGDGTNDWQFIERCGYGAAMGNASDELKQLVVGKGDRSFVGKSVDQNGILDIFDYFKL